MDWTGMTFDTPRTVYSGCRIGKLRLLFAFIINYNMRILYTLLVWRASPFTLGGGAGPPD